MIAAVLIALSAAAATPVSPITGNRVLEEAQHAIVAGRLDQAKLMIGNAIAAGASGAQLDRALADLAFASDKNAEALAWYQQLLTTSPADPLLLERGGIAAFKVGDFDRAAALIG